MPRVLGGALRCLLLIHPLLPLPSSLSPFSLHTETKESQAEPSNAISIEFSLEIAEDPPWRTPPPVQPLLNSILIRECLGFRESQGEFLGKPNRTSGIAKESVWEIIWGSLKERLGEPEVAPRKSRESVWESEKGRLESQGESVWESQRELLGDSGQGSGGAKFQSWAHSQGGRLGEPERERVWASKGSFWERQKERLRQGDPAACRGDRAAHHGDRAARLGVANFGASAVEPWYHGPTAKWSRVLRVTWSHSSTHGPMVPRIPKRT